MPTGFGFTPWGIGPWGGTGGVGGPPTSYEVELPGVYLDAGIEDTANPTVPVLINRVPEPGDTQVPIDTLIELELAATNSTVQLASTKVYVEGVLAFDGGVFTAAFDGIAAAYSNPQPDILRIVLDPTTPFSSQQVVSVRVVSALAITPNALTDVTYEFTCEDLTVPIISAVEAQELRRLRVTFSEPVVQASALTALNWVLAYQSTPAVTAVVTEVAVVSDSQFDLTTDIELTPGAVYLLTVSNVADLWGNVVTAPGNAATFIAFTPAKPETRRFDLWRMLPEMNRREDITGDLLKFIKCLQEPTDLLLYDIDRFLDTFDPDIADEQYLDAMLVDLGNPFTFDLTSPHFDLDTGDGVDDKQRLVQVLVEMYRLKGTAPGIKNVVLFFLGLQVEVVPYVDELTMTLGESELGGPLDTDWNLGASNTFLLYSFRVTVETALTDTQRTQVRAIVEYMKPAHTHFIELVEPAIPLVLDHMELGLSELGGDEWMLH